MNQFALAPACTQVSNTARVASANPHQLITILFEEALDDLGRAGRAIMAGDLAAKSRHLSHAATLVAALDCSLDHEKGGEIARSLATVYAFVRARILRAGLKNDADQCRIAAETLGEIASAWREIA